MYSRNIVKLDFYDEVPPFRSLFEIMGTIGSVEFLDASVYEHFAKYFKISYQRTSSMRANRMQEMSRALESIFKGL